MPVYPDDWVGTMGKNAQGNDVMSTWPCRYNVEDKPVATYWHALYHWDFREEWIGAVKVMRAEARQHHEAMKGEQKLAQQMRDFEMARWWSDCSKDVLRLYRATCLVLGYMSGGLGGDTPYVPMREWPVELGEELDSVINRVTI